MNRLKISPGIENRLRVGVAWFRGADASAENPSWNEMEALA